MSVPRSATVKNSKFPYKKSKAYTQIFLRLYIKSYILNSKAFDDYVSTKAYPLFINFSPSTVNIHFSHKHYKNPNTR